MATREYCSNVSLELEQWSEKLHKLSSEIDHISTGDKYRVFPQIEELHMILTELDDRLCGLLQSCPTTEAAGIGEGVEGAVFASRLNWNSKERFDYEFGG